MLSSSQSGCSGSKIASPRVVLYRRLAEIGRDYLNKGRAGVPLKTRQWTDKTRQVRYTTEIEGWQMKMLGAGRA